MINAMRSDELLVGTCCVLSLVAAAHRLARTEGAA
jgi:hypothetical protein